MFLVLLFVKVSLGYLIAESFSDDYPVPKISSLFKVVDSEIPNDWHFCVEKGNLDPPYIVYKEWAKNPLFYEHLLNEEEYALKIFQEQQKIAKKEIQAFLSNERNLAKNIGALY